MSAFKASDNFKQTFFQSRKVLVRAPGPRDKKYVAPGLQNRTTEALGLRRFTPGLCLARNQALWLGSKEKMTSGSGLQEQKFQSFRAPKTDHPLEPCLLLSRHFNLRTMIAASYLS